MKPHEIQGSPQWLEYRRTRIGASEAPIIQGVSPWKTPFALYEEKLGLRPIDAPNSAMKRGTALEEEARRAFIDHTGIVVVAHVLQHKEYEWMIASLDGITLERDEIVELKCSGKEDHETALSGQIPDKYYPQLQHQMCVCGLDEIHYFSYFPATDGMHDAPSIAHIMVQRDDKYIAELLIKEQEFMQCLRTHTPPDLMDRDYKHMDDMEWAEAVFDYKYAQKQRKRFEAIEDTARDRLLYFADGRNCEGAGVKVTKYTRKGNIEYGAIEALKGIDLEKYRKKDTINFRITSDET